MKIARTTDTPFIGGRETYPWVIHYLTRIDTLSDVEFNSSFSLCDSENQDGHNKIKNKIEKDVHTPNILFLFPLMPPGFPRLWFWLCVVRLRGARRDVFHGGRNGACHLHHNFYLIGIGIKRRDQWRESKYLLRGICSVTNEMKIARTTVTGGRRTYPQETKENHSWVIQWPRIDTVRCPIHRSPPKRNWWCVVGFRCAARRFSLFLLWNVVVRCVGRNGVSPDQLLLLVVVIVIIMIKVVMRQYCNTGSNGGGCGRHCLFHPHHNRNWIGIGINRDQSMNGDTGSIGKIQDRRRRRSSVFYDIDTI